MPTFDGNMASIVSIAEYLPAILFLVFLRVVDVPEINYHLLVLELTLQSFYVVNLSTVPTLLKLYTVYDTFVFECVCYLFTNFNPSSKSFDSDQIRSFEFPNTRGRQKVR